MKITFAAPSQPKTGALAVAVAKDRALSKSAAALDKAAGGALGRAMAVSRFSGKKGELLEVLAPVLSRSVVISFAERVVMTARRLGAPSVGWCVFYYDEDSRRLAEAMARESSRRELARQVYAEILEVTHGVQRVAAMVGLSRVWDEGCATMIREAMDEDDPRVRSTGERVLLRLEGRNGVPATRPE